MDTINDTPVDRKNKHLSAFERGEIASLLKEGYRAYAIAKKLGRAYNTIRAELDRGTVTQIKNDREVKVYYPDTGQLIYERNRENSKKQYKLLQCQAFIKHVVKQFR
ncbi:MAG: helix-turn-helix domain-containing protein, partial [Bacillota bacterium]|nr:helix-turn-helix domain-containing protein [Bacillota bacterium]